MEFARIQFIQREFAEFLAGAELIQTEVESERMGWIHDRLFVDGWSEEQVRHVLTAAYRRGRIIAVTSGKGGVGKTTVAVNLAVAFAQSGQRTLLFDGDLGMGNVHVFAGIDPQYTLLDVLDGTVGLPEAVANGPAGLKVVCGASGVSRVANIDQRQLDELASHLRWLAVDFETIVIDTGAGIGADVLTLLRLADKVTVVATPNLASTLDAYGVIKAAHEAQIDAAIGVLANQAKSEGEALLVRDRLVSCAARFLQLTVRDLGWIPRTDRIETANQSRRAVVDSARNSEISRRFRMLASDLLAEREPNVPDSSSSGSAAA